MLIMGLVSKGATCDVDGCSNSGTRSLNKQRVEDAGLRIANNGKKAILCKEHYKEWKKETRKDRDLERARYDNR